MDRSLLFQLQSALKLFTVVADAVAWALFTSGIRFVLHYLNDFFVPQSSREVAGLRDKADMVFSRQGVPVATHKIEGTGTQVTFLGFELDMVAFQPRLPQDKHEWMRDMVHGWCTRQNCTHHKLESLLGQLSHTAVAIHPGSLFLRQLFGILLAYTDTIPAGIEWHHPVSSQGSCVYGFSDASGSFVVGQWFLMGLSLVTSGPKLVDNRYSDEKVYATCWQLSCKDQIGQKSMSSSTPTTW